MVGLRTGRDEDGMLLSTLDEFDFQWNDPNNPNQEKINKRVLAKLKVVYQRMKAAGMLLCRALSRPSLSPPPNLFQLFLAGWKRDVIREGIEPNPGPITWNAIKKKLVETYGPAWNTAILEFETELRSTYKHTLDQMDEEDVRPLVNENHPLKFKRIVWAVMKELKEGLFFSFVSLVSSSYFIFCYVLAHSYIVFLQPVPGVL